MTHIVAPLGFAVLFWWISTGIVLVLVGMPRATHKWTAIAATAGLGAATIALLALRDETSVAAAYQGFAVGVSLWAWHEIMFLLGFISGPRKTPCPPGLEGWRRFVVSSETVIHHELAIAIHGCLILILSWGAPNAVAAWTFFLLWGMRISAKLIVFFGAPNVSESFLPAHLDYLKSYFQKRRVSPFFSLAVTLAVSTTALIAFRAASAPVGSFEAIGLTLVAALGVLAVIEHWALVAPLPDSALWSWALPSSSTKPDPQTPPEWRR